MLGAAEDDVPVLGSFVPAVSVVEPVNDDAMDIGRSNVRALIASGLSWGYRAVATARIPVSRNIRYCLSYLIHVLLLDSAEPTRLSGGSKAASSLWVPSSAIRDGKSETLLLHEVNTVL